MTADAYATAFMVMGLESAKHLVENNDRLKAFFIYSDSIGTLQTWQSANFPH